MSRIVCVVAIFLSTSFILIADPIKKPLDSDKLSKECAEAYVKALLEKKADDALKLCADPLLNSEGEADQSVRGELRKDIEAGFPPGFDMKVGEVFELSKFNDWLEKNQGKKLDEKQINKYGEILGADGRVVSVEITIQGKKPPTLVQPHMLIRMKDGKAQIIAMGRR